MTKQEMYDFIKKALDDIVINGPTDIYLGICENVLNRLPKEQGNLKDDISDVLESLFMDWPDKSHSDVYPIGKWSQKPYQLFWHHFDNKISMWDRSTQYGAARWSLLEFVREQLKEL